MKELPKSPSKIPTGDHRPRVDDDDDRGRCMVCGVPLAVGVYCDWCRRASRMMEGGNWSDEEKAKFIRERKEQLKEDRLKKEGRRNDSSGV